MKRLKSEELKYPSVFTISGGVVIKVDLQNFIDVYMQKNFEKLAEDWWAKRLRDTQFQEEQERIENLWDRAERPGPTQTFIERWPPPSYIKQLRDEPIRERQYRWSSTRECWVEVYDKE